MTLVRECSCGDMLPVGRRHDHRDRGSRPTDRAAWKRRSRADRARHLATVGPICPGWRRDPHRVRPEDLTDDHVVPIVAGGALLGETRVMCRSCNSARREAPL